MSILNKLDGKGFKPLAATSTTSPEQKAPITHKELNEIIERQNAIITEQNAKLKAMTSAVSALMGMVTRLKAEKPQAEAAQKEESGTMAALRKKFGI